MIIIFHWQNFIDLQQVRAFLNTFECKHKVPLSKIRYNQTIGHDANFFLYWYKLHHF